MTDTEATYVNIEGSYDGINFSHIAHLDYQLQYYSFQTFCDKERFYFKVKFEDEDGNVVQSEILSSRITKNPSRPKSLTIVTVNDEFTFDNNNLDRISVCDLSGRTLLKIDGSDKNHIDLSSFTQGIYLVNFMGKTINSSKLIYLVH
ncbi:MAG: T9SS type A sorting domain-containing protein [Maribacter sp.]|nr:T9SS type A sorting domain-containing protein [Maribacter sp.]